MELPEKITIRWVSWMIPGQLIIEHDGVQVSSEDNVGEDESVVKAAEVAFASLGYKPDLRRMYVDMGLIVLHMYRDAIPE